MKMVNIREATRDDCQEIRRLIQELADFEKMPDGPMIDTKVLEDEGFGCDHPSFGCYVIEELNEDGTKKKLIAFALYFYSFSSWYGKSIYLEDIYVSSEYRGQGYGSKLFNLVVKKGLGVGCRHMDLRVLNWNPALEFYKRKGGIDLTSTSGRHCIALDTATMEKIAARSND